MQNKNNNNKLKKVKKVKKTKKHIQKGDKFSKNCNLCCDSFRTCGPFGSENRAEEKDIEQEPEDHEDHQQEYLEDDDWAGSDREGKI